MYGSWVRIPAGSQEHKNASLDEAFLFSVVNRSVGCVLGIFGSYARNEENQLSDLDILIDSNVKLDLLTLIGLEHELSETLGLKVDLITLRSVHPSLKKYIEADLLRIL